MSIRDKVSQLARSDYGEALALAEKIKDGCERAQALGWVLRFAPADRTSRIFEKACDAAEEGTDEFQRAIGKAWPFRAMIEIGSENKIGKRFRAVVERVPTIHPVSSRAEAILLLLQSVAPGPGEYMKSMAGILVRECGQTGHWRVTRAMQDAALILNGYDEKIAMQIALAILPTSKRHTTVEKIGNGESRAARPFFW